MENVPWVAIAAIATAVQALATLVLIGVTAWYARSAAETLRSIKVSTIVQARAPLSDRAISLVMFFAN